jgi:ribosome-binding factor A
MSSPRAERMEKQMQEQMRYVLQECGRVSDLGIVQAYVVTN